MPMSRSRPGGGATAASVAVPDGTLRGGCDVAGDGSGLRREEAVALDLEDYHRGEGQLRVHGKGSKERLAHLASGADAALDAWIALRSDEPGPLFVPINKAGRLDLRRLSGQAIRLILRKRARLAGVADFSPHDARRTWMGSLLSQGADIAIVAGLAGHASPSTTARYDRRGEVARRDAARLLHVPYRHPQPHADDDGKPQNG